MDYVELPASLRQRLEAETGVSHDGVSRVLATLVAAGWKLVPPVGQPIYPQSLILLVQDHDGSVPCSMFRLEWAAELSGLGLASVSHQWGEGTLRVSEAGQRLYRRWQTDGLSPAQKTALRAIAHDGGWARESRGHVGFWVHGCKDAAAVLTLGEFNDLTHRRLLDRDGQSLAAGAQEALVLLGEPAPVHV